VAKSKKWVAKWRDEWLNRKMSVLVEGWAAKSEGWGAKSEGWVAKKRDGWLSQRNRLLSR
jgi:hypothetical protein